MSRGRRQVLADAVLAGGPVVVAHGPLVGGEPLSPRDQELQRTAFEQGRAEGVEAGRQAGRAEGRREAGAELASARQALTAALRELGEGRRRFFAEARASVLDLALAVARKVIRAEAEASAGVAARVVAAAIARAGEARGETLRVRVHPRDRERIEQADPERAAPELVADPSVSPGGCVVETDCGSIDATVESQWGAIQAALEEVAEAESA